MVATICLKAAPHIGRLGSVSAVCYLTVAVAIACSTVTRYHQHLQGMHAEQSRPRLLEVIALSTVTTALSVHLLCLIID